MARGAVVGDVAAVPRRARLVVLAREEGSSVSTDADARRKEWAGQEPNRWRPG